MNFNEEAWIEACRAWVKISGVIGFKTRKDAFLQGYYIAHNKLKPVVPLIQDLEKLYPKYNCPKCGDWFHMPYKFCKCDGEE
jgi:hypothetical protein